jgi:phosphate transport system substrate-binding protein
LDIAELPVNYDELIIFTMTGAFDAVIYEDNAICYTVYYFEVYAAIRSDLDKSSMAYKLYEWFQTKAGKQIISESGYIPYIAK